MPKNDTQITYKNAGVDIDAGNKFVKQIKPLAKKTLRKGAVDSLGGFAASFDLRKAGFRDAILVSATDGVGTKLRIATETDRYETVGIDLVAMCANDLICQGAEPLFFLDYYSTGKLENEKAVKVVKGISDGCIQAGLALIGGETAEMPGMYDHGHFDLAGFAVGAMERDEILPANIEIGDAIIGIASSGLHSNGFSLIRKIVTDFGLNYQATSPFSKDDLGTELLKPTKIYVKPILQMRKEKIVKGLAHITGGGIVDNVPRILSEGQGAQFFLSSWSVPPIFKWLLKITNLQIEESLKTFNCGIGMVLVVAQKDVNKSLELLSANGEKAYLIGEITNSSRVEFLGDFNYDK